MKNNSFSIISLAVSVISLLVSSYIICNENRFNADWYAIVIGILSLLVTVLIGWNIYTVIDFKKEIDKMREQNSTMQKSIADTLLFTTKESSKLSIATYSALMELYGKLNKDEAEPYLRYALTTLMFQSSIGDINGCNITTMAMNEAMPSNLGLRKFDKQQLLNLAYNINQPDLIAGFLSFRERLSNVSTFD